MLSVFNEEEYAKKILKNGFLSKKIRFELKILAKYWFFTEKKEKFEIKELLISFCERKMPGFNFNMYYEVINETIRYLFSKKCKYIVINDVFVSDEFVRYFDSLDCEPDIQRFLFALAVLGKVNEKLGYDERFCPSHNDYRDVRLSAGIKFETDFYNVTNQLYKKGIISMTSGGNINLLFLDDIPKGEPIYKISDFHHIGDWLSVYKGERRRYICEKCGSVFEKRNPKSNSQKYCNQCSSGTKTKPKKSLY